MPKNYVYFDLETIRSANDVGGWNNKGDMGMSVGVTYSTETNEYIAYPEKKVEELDHTAFESIWLDRIINPLFGWHSTNSDLT